MSDLGGIRCPRFLVIGRMFFLASCAIRTAGNTSITDWRKGSGTGGDQSSHESHATAFSMAFYDVRTAEGGLDPIYPSNRRIGEPFEAWESWSPIAMSFRDSVKERGKEALSRRFAGILNPSGICLAR